MAKFDLEKYWDFRVWVKSQIAQLRALLSEYQQNGGGGGTGGGDFDPNGSYPNMSVGTATKATSATTAERATKATTADKAATADYATSADTAKKAAIADSALFADSATIADKATTADSATHADSADSATIANSAMKAEYATNAGNAERATIANSAESAKSAASASTAALAINLQNAPELTTSNEQIVVKVGNKTSNALTVPYAQRADFATDLSGRVEATPEIFTYRPSAGDKSIKDDNAFIRRVKGNSVVFNQILVPRNLTETSNGITVTQDGTGKVVVKGTATGRAQVSVGTAQIISGHKYIYFGLVGDGANKFYWTDQTVSADTGKGVIAQPTYASGNRYFFLNVLQGVTVDFTFYPQVSDLTAMFGTGNEPTAEEFRALYPNSYYPYNAGELRNLVCSGIKTVGFNEFNGTYARVLPNESYYLGGSYTSIGFAKELGGATETISIPSNRIYTPTQLGYIYATGTDICVNLHHTGYRDGEYEPYKEVTHALPLSKITNGEPLRKAGSVYDEINETEYIRRVGVVDLGSLVWTNAANNIFACTEMPNMIVTTDVALRLDGLFCTKYAIDTILSIDATMSDKTMKRNNGWLYIKDTSFTDVASFKASLSGILLHYELAEPIVTPIETPLDLNYYVEDFGTEEALLADDSAPFSADVVYQFNAVDNIRQNRISIQKLNDIFSGSGGEYVRADGSWGYIADLKGNFFVKPTLKRIRTGISELSDTIQIIHPYLTEHVGDAKIVLMAVKRRGGTYYDRATNAKGRRKKRKAWGELHYAAMPNTEINHNTIEMPNGASFEAWQNAILNACGRIPEGLENAREPYNVNVAFEDLADFFAANGAIFVGKTPVIRLGVALRIPNPNFIDYGNGNKMWDYNDVTGKWEYKYLYSDVAEVVVKSQMLRTGGYVLGLELV